ncbi:uncharacterized protein LOC142403329 [Mycteria americana]|uniref:uncharacterized protein LOC142403329 n=1 Tax=Mycteria americana TaxID=33587 RepID=UPI003F5889FB
MAAAPSDLRDAPLRMRRRRFPPPHRTAHAPSPRLPAQPRRPCAGTASPSALRVRRAPCLPRRACAPGAARPRACALRPAALPAGSRSPRRLRLPIGPALRAPLSHWLPPPHPSLPLAAASRAVPAPSPLKGEAGVFPGLPRGSPDNETAAGNRERERGHGGCGGATWAGLSLLLLLPVAERLAGARLHLSPPPGHPLVVSIPARDWMALTARQRLGALGRRLATLRGRWGALGSGAGTRRWGALLRWDLRDLGRAIASELGEPPEPPRPPAPRPAPPPGEWGRRREALALLRATEAFLLRALRDFLLLCRAPPPGPAPRPRPAATPRGPAP